MAIDTGTSLDTGASDITYTGDEGPRSPEQQLMASADPMLVEEYQKYVFEMEEQGLPTMSFKQFVQQIMSGMAGGGIARLGFYQGGGPHSDGPSGNASGGGGEGQGRSGALQQIAKASAQTPGRPTYQNVHQTGAVTRTPGRPTYQNVHQTGAVTRTPGRSPVGITSNYMNPTFRKATIDFLKQRQLVNRPVTTSGQSPFGYTTPNQLGTANTGGGGGGGTDDYRGLSWSDFINDPGIDIKDIDIDMALARGLSTKDVYRQWFDKRKTRIGNAQGGIARLGFQGGYRAGAHHEGMPGGDATGEAGEGQDDRFKQYAENIVNIPPPKEGGDWEDQRPEQKTIIEKAKEKFLGPTLAAVRYIGKKTMPMYLRSVLKTHKKNIGYDDDPYADEDERYQAIVDAIEKAERGELSNEEFQKFVPDWQKNLGAEGGQQGQDFLKYPRDLHPGTGGITDATGTTLGPTWSTDPVQLAAASTGVNIPGAANFYSNLDPSVFDPATEIYTAAYGGRVPAAYGGIMDSATGRRRYGLGSIFKKIAKPFKKVLKSKLGKAALMAGLFHFGPGLLSGTGLGIGKGRGLAGWQKLIAGKMDPSKGGLNIWRGILGPSALGYFTADKEDDDSDYLKWHEKEKAKYLAQMGGPWPTDPVQFTAQGGRIGYRKGTRKKGYADYVQAMNALGLDPMPIGIYNSLSSIMSDQEMVNMGSPGKAQGGRIGYADGGYDEDEEEDHRAAALSAMYGLRKNAQEGGLMNMGGMEKDYRQEGGFVPIGGQEKADDVPARLSKNEFVFTADAVRAAGGGDIDAGAEVMENVMENLERGGQVSEESQGLEGARNMFATAKRLEGVL